MARINKLFPCIFAALLVPACADTEDDLMDTGDGGTGGTGGADDGGTGDGDGGGSDGGDGGGGDTGDGGSDGGDGDTGGSDDGGDDDGGGDDPGTGDDGGTGGGDDGGTGDDGGNDDGDTGGGDDCQVGTTVASKVVIIGDSYLAQTNVPSELEDLARAAGSLGSGESYRDYSVGGTQMGNGQIPGQYDTAKGEDAAIETIIMTGGGNDVLIGDAMNCLDSPPPDQGCVDNLDVVFNAAADLLMTMTDDGVENVVYFFYPHLPEQAFPFGSGKNETLDYSYPMVRALCEGAGLDCYFVDTREAFEGHPEYIGDGIHPTAEGSKVIADLLWATMQDNCIAQ